MDKFHCRITLWGSLLGSSLGTQKSGFGSFLEVKYTHTPCTRMCASGHPFILWRVRRDLPRGVARPVYARAARPSILWSRGTCLTTPPVPLRASRKIKLNNEKDAAEVSEIAKAMVKHQKD